MGRDWRSNLGLIRHSTWRSENLKAPGLVSAWRARVSAWDTDREYKTVGGVAAKEKVWNV